MSLSPELRSAEPEVQDAFAAGRAVIDRLRAGDVLTDEDRAVLAEMLLLREEAGLA